jgi:CDP-6-deoxy-D-xylo-4-hexulose-3-dehydrase
MTEQPRPAPRNIDYVGAYYDETEIEAVVEVLRGSLRVGDKVARFERRVADAWGKAHGIMVNSGSSALELAFDLMALEPGDEFLTPAVTFSTTVAGGIRSGLVPAVVDVEPDTYCIDVDAAEAMVSDRTRAMVVPNLAGNCPDWDALRSLADRHDLVVVEDSADTFGPRLRGTPTGTRSDISTTSFAMSHILTCAGNGGMVMVDRDDWWDEALLYRRWGRSSEPRFYGTRQDDRGRFLVELDGVPYDALFVFERLGHNFEPSELGAAFGLVQLERVTSFAARRRVNVAAHNEFFGRWPEVFVTPREVDELETTWLQYPLQISVDAPFTRTEFQQHLKARGVATRMVWTGNLLRQPMMAGVRHRSPEHGCPHADAVMERGVLIPCHQTMDDEDLAHVHGAVSELLI